MSAVVLASSNNPLRAVTVESNDFDIDGGRRLSGMQAAAFLFAQGLRSIQAAADYNQQGVSDRSRATVRPPNPPFPANTAPVTIDQFAERIKELYGVDPLIEFSAGVGLDGYSIADINRIVDQINREFDFDLAPLDAQTILGAQSTVSDDARDARVSAVRVLTRTEVEGAARDGHLESGNVYVDRHGSFFLDGAKTSPVEISLAIRSAAHDNISGELATLLGKVAQRAQDSSYADEVKSSVDEILEANPVEAPTSTQFEKISSIMTKLDDAIKLAEACKTLRTGGGARVDPNALGSANLTLKSLAGIKGFIEQAGDNLYWTANGMGKSGTAWANVGIQPGEIVNKQTDRLVGAINRAWTGNDANNADAVGASGYPGQLDFSLAQKVFEYYFTNDGKAGEWSSWDGKWGAVQDTDGFHTQLNRGLEDTWTDFSNWADADENYPAIKIANLMEELRAADPTLMPSGWDSGMTLANFKTWKTDTLNTAWSAKAQAYDDYQRGVSASTVVLASSTGTTAQQAAYKQLQAAFEKVKSEAGESSLISRLLQGAGQSSGKVIGGAVGDSSTQVSFTRAQLQEIAAALGSVRERSLKDNEQDQIRMQKLNGLLTQNIEAMSALVKAFEQLSQSLVQSLKR
jgi:hypothetical protein